MNIYINLPIYSYNRRHLKQFKVFIFFFKSITYIAAFFLNRIETSVFFKNKSGILIVVFHTVCCYSTSNKFKKPGLFITVKVIIIE